MKYYKSAQLTNEASEHETLTMSDGSVLMMRLDDDPEMYMSGLVDPLELDDVYGC